MTATISIGDEAPDFDLSSTEGVLLMLRDEVPRTSVLLYVFEDPASERVRADLKTLAEARSTLAEIHVKILGLAPAKMTQLMELQVDLGLLFPLLRDDRSFCAEYGVKAEEGQDPEPALVLVNCEQRVAWLENPVSSVAASMPEVLSTFKRRSSTTSNYPKSVINRLVEFWVN